jgi:hypothetical protein
LRIFAKQATHFPQAGSPAWRFASETFGIFGASFCLRGWQPERNLKSILHEVHLAQAIAKNCYQTVTLLWLN